ncbi:hypothetical protein CFD26_107319 [Aspergillus turcosus]|uniref:Uncharacterized protein n=1 Tax=Aspergillus turcosus TaxID=1245748 RepID=A0A421DD49_9EURO|nr:hypothetical protein CFD26_107319 [Aspergillus turcosus]
MASDKHPAILTSAAGLISLAWSLKHHEDISDDGVGGINSIVLGTIAYAFLWSLIALAIRLVLGHIHIHPGIYLAFDLVAFLANVSTRASGWRCWRR